MPIKTGTFYMVMCKQCGWSDNVFMPMIGRSSPIPILTRFLDKMRLPSKCPKCGNKLKSKENPFIRQ